MKRKLRHLLPLMLLAAFFYGSGVIASSPAKVDTSGPQDCKTGCAQKRDLALQKCARHQGDSATICQNNANGQYDKCVQDCDAGGRSIGGGDGKKP